MRCVFTGVTRCVFKVKVLDLIFVSYSCSIQWLFRPALFKMVLQEAFFYLVSLASVLITLVISVLLREAAPL